MSVRVRFAPSPTGYLHIGGLRTALYNYLFAKANNGEFILRIEDTDLERSKREYEELQIADLKWAGLSWAEGPDKPGDFGPYRQSERLDIYKRFAEQLIDEGKAYYCFCTDEDLEKQKEKAMAENRDPHYDGTHRDYPKDEALKRIANGEKAVVRFKVNQKPYTLHDEVRGSVEFPKNMVGDFVIIRSNGLPVYNFCCVVDDALMKITHVFRGEDHLNNTLRQLMIYEALGFELPKLGHVSLLIGADRQKLSKRHGATSVTQYREGNYLPEALNNYLCLLGWSHPDEKDVFTMEEIAPIFESKRFSKAPATYDIEKLKYINSSHIKLKSDEECLSEAIPWFKEGNPVLSQDKDWQLKFIHLFKEKIDFYTDLNHFGELVFTESFNENDEFKEVLSWESTSQMKAYLSSEIKRLTDEGKASPAVEDFEAWTNYLKKEMKIKGKQLFKGIRLVLTGATEGSDLKQLIPLTPCEVIARRIQKLGT